MAESVGLEFGAGISGRPHCTAGQRGVRDTGRGGGGQCIGPTRPAPGLRWSGCARRCGEPCGGEPLEAPQRARPVEHGRLAAALLGPSSSAGTTGREPPDAMAAELCAKWTEVGVDGQRLSEGFDREGSNSLGLTESVSGRVSTHSVSSRDSFQEDVPSWDMAGVGAGGTPGGGAFWRSVWGVGQAYVVNMYTRGLISGM